MVSGVVGLMLSVNPELSADEVRSILTATADRDLELVPDLPNDPNLQGFTGDFDSGHSLFFGSGKVNARRAVTRARALLGPSSGEREGTASPGLAIPDNLPQGVVSSIDIASPGAVQDIQVDVNITHTYRGDLAVTLVSPQGFTAELHRVRQGGGADHLIRSYDTTNSPELATLASGGVEGQGTWKLHVADRLRRDTGKLNSWSISLT
ncbi:MAG: proprotein convertase P-domain-containing protein [Planctomycetota bacterium]